MLSIVLFEKEIFLAELPVIEETELKLTSDDCLFIT